MPVGVVSGLLRETECLTPDGKPHPDLMTFAGVGPERAAQGARDLLAAGARGLISFGVAGSMAPGAPAGALVLADAVLHEAERFETDVEWRSRIVEKLGDGVPVVRGSVIGVDGMVATAEAKAALAQTSGAMACDMESHAVAAVAAEAGVPFIVLRAISDPHTHDVPVWVLRCLTPKGGVRTGRLLGQLARRPWAVPELMMLARDSKRAFGTLRRVAHLTGPGFALGL